MRLEFQLVILLIVSAAICTLVLCYDIKKHKKIKQLEREIKELRKVKNDYYNADAVAAMNGK
jgi:Tfp pilus assembly protein PilO